MSSTQNMKILIIDDNPALVNVFANMLRIRNYNVTAETNLKSGLQHFENEFYDVSFVDAPLDDYDEKQILSLFQENKIFQKTNVILFSSTDLDASELDKWKRCGLHSYLKKPVKQKIILDILDDIDVRPIDEPTSESEEATPEQLSRLEKLEKQIQELTITPKQSMKKLNIHTNKTQKEIETTLSEISELKNKIQSLGEINNTQSENNFDSLNEKKPTKKVKPTKTKIIK